MGTCHDRAVQRRGPGTVARVPPAASPGVHYHHRHTAEAHATEANDPAPPTDRGHGFIGTAPGAPSHVTARPRDAFRQLANPPSGLRNDNGVWGEYWWMGFHVKVGKGRTPAHNRADKQQRVRDDRHSRRARPRRRWAPGLVPERFSQRAAGDQYSDYRTADGWSAPESRSDVLIRHGVLCAALIAHCCCDSGVVAEPRARSWVRLARRR